MPLMQRSTQCCVPSLLEGRGPSVTAASAALCGHAYSERRDGGCRRCDRGRSWLPPRLARGPGRPLVTRHRPCASRLRRCDAVAAATLRWPTMSPFCAVVVACEGAPVRAARPPLGAASPRSRRWSMQSRRARLSRLPVRWSCSGSCVLVEHRRTPSLRTKRYGPSFHDFPPSTMPKTAGM